MSRYSKPGVDFVLIVLCTPNDAEFLVVTATTYIDENASVEEKLNKFV